MRRKIHGWIGMLLMAIFLLSGCGGGGSFDFRTEDLTPYVSFGDRDYRDVTISVERIEELTDAEVRAEFDSYFSESEYYLPIAEDTKAIEEGDLLYLHYTGILVSALDKAVTEGKIPDQTCTGMTYEAIKALSLGFSGGTTSQLMSLEIGNGNYIEGFEEGLIGLVPSEHGPEAPYALRLRFPEEYREQSLAGQEVIFFCALGYIGDVSDGDDSPTWTYDLLDVDMVNFILGLTGSNAYPNMESCLAKIRDGMKEEAYLSQLSEKKEALWKAWEEMTVKLEVPDAAAETYIQEILEERYAEMEALYESSPEYYYYIFGTTSAPTMTALIQYMGYNMNNYMEEMKEDAMPAIRQELLYWYLVRAENYTLSDAELQATRTEFEERYGENVFDGYEEEVIRDLLIREKFTEDFLTRMEENGQIQYTQKAE